MFWQTRHILGGIKSTYKWNAGALREECKNPKVMTHVHYSASAEVRNKQRSTEFLNLRNKENEE